MKFLCTEKFDSVCDIYVCDIQDMQCMLSSCHIVYANAMM